MILSWRERERFRRRVAVCWNIRMRKHRTDAMKHTKAQINGHTSRSVLQPAPRLPMPVERGKCYEERPYFWKFAQRSSLVGLDHLWHVCEWIDGFMSVEADDDAAILGRTTTYEIVVPSQTAPDPEAWCITNATWVIKKTLSSLLFLHF